MATIEANNGCLRLCDGTTWSILEKDQKDVHVRASGVVTPVEEFSQVFVLNTHVLFVGQAYPFNKVAFSLALAAVGAGKLVVEYWDGGAWWEIRNVHDDTNGLSRSGIVSWDYPEDWKKQKLFYVRMRTTISPKSAPIVKFIRPCGGQFLDLPFSHIKIEGPQARFRPEEKLVQDRYSDQPRFFGGPERQEPMMLAIEIELSRAVEVDVINKAMFVANLGIETWPLEGVSTKAMSEVPDASGKLKRTSIFDDCSRTVDLQVQYGDTIWEWSEVYFTTKPFEQNHLALAGMRLEGACYGAIYSNRIKALGMEIAA